MQKVSPQLIKHGLDVLLKDIQLLQILQDPLDTSLCQLLSVLGTWTELYMKHVRQEIQLCTVMTVLLYFSLMWTNLTRSGMRTYSKWRVRVEKNKCLYMHNLKLQNK